MDQETTPLPSDVIRLRRADNPKRPGTKTFRRYALYKDGMTIAQHKEAVEHTLGNDQARQCYLDHQWDSDPKRDFIRIERNGKPISIRRSASMSYDRKRS